MNSVLIIKYAQRLGGGEIATLRLVKGLNQLGRPTFLALNQGSPVWVLARKAGLTKLLSLPLPPEPVSRLTILWFVLVYPAALAVAGIWLADLIRRQGIKTVVCQNLNDKLFFSWLGRRLKLRVVWWEHQSWDGLKTHPFLGWIKSLAFLVDQIIVPTNFLAAELTSLGIPAERLSKVSHGVALAAEARNQDVRAKLRIPAAAIVIGFIGRLDREKGLDDLVKAVADILAGSPRRRMNLSLLVVGEGPLRLELEEESSYPQLAGRINWVGFQADPLAYLQAMDIVALPSKRDNAPLVLLEAMAAGKAVIAKNVGGVPELLTRQTGLLVNSQAELEQGLKRLATDPALRRRLGQAAAARARQHFSEATMLKRMNSVLGN